MTDKRYRILLAGESWVSTATHIKGFDQFSTVTFHLGAEPLVEALKDSAFDLRYMPAHEAQRDFPQTPEAIAAYDAVILSDIGSNTLLLHPDTWIHGRRTPNRLRLLKAFVENGGGLLMVGGYYSFQGINGGARYHGTPVEDALPVDILPYDDRVEAPEGFTPAIKLRRAPHPRRPRGRLAVAARLQRGQAEARRGDHRHGVGGVRRTTAARRRKLRQGPHARLDLGHRPALATPGIRGLAGICAALATGARMARRRPLNRDGAA